MRTLAAALLFALLCLVPAHAQLVPPDTTEGRTSLAYPEDPFINYSAGDGGAGFVKFAIILSHPGTVYFQDSNLYPFHYDFATQRLQPFLGMSHQQFDAATLRRAGQQAVLGAVIFPPFGSAREYGIQLAGLDPYTKEEVKARFDAVKAAVSADPAAAAIYIPAFEQKAQAEADRAWLAGQGIEVDGLERWITSTAIYADGWAFGRLVFVPGGQIDAAYAAGTLKPSDVLLTDGVPAEVPFVAGILSLSAATPNSHVAILARNQRIPFAWVAGAAEQARIQALAGREVLMRAARQGGEALRVSAVDANLEPGIRAQILKFKAPAVVQVKPRQHLGQLTVDAATLFPGDIDHFGGKAANFGLIRRTVPEASPPAIAFSFDLWEQFLENTNPDSGLTLREEVQQRLGGFAYPPNLAQARAELDAVRKIIRNKMEFTAAQRDAIIAALTNAGFRTTRMLRFRSSSNAEDTVQFSGAGLYESFSGCLADEIDGDTAGPCACADPALEPKEKTVTEAIRKVFASFYNDNAWLERLRHRIPEDQVGMALLVHENDPDADEMANGVATVKVRPGFAIGEREFELELVTQLGAVSVTNPEGGAKAEVVVAGQSGDHEPFLFTQQHSDLVQLGANVMTWEADYRLLVSHLVKVAKGYAQLFPAKKTFTLDLEFKKLQPGFLRVRQVRELPEPVTQLVSPILLNEPLDLVIHQTEGADAFAYHRLKSTLAVETRNVKLTSPALLAPLHLRSTFDFIIGGTPERLANGPAGWPGYRFAAPKPGVQTETWRGGTSAPWATFGLRSTLPTRVDATVSPVITTRDLTHRLTAYHPYGARYLDFSQTPRRRTSDSAFLVPRDSLPPDDTLQTRRIATAGGVSIAPEFHWPKYSGFVIIKTFPLAAWERTTITGLTTTPLVLTGEFAQTYAPGHHNFYETFIFEPRLDPGVTDAQRAELKAANIRLLHVYHDVALGGEDAIHVLGFDRKFRRLP